MANDITNTVLLEHMQGMKYEFEQKFNRINERLNKFEQKVATGFEEARRHRQVLQEDLEATILLQAKHDTQLKGIAA